MKQIYSTFTNTNYGSVGIQTPMTYSNGSPIHTGDIVSVSHKYHPYLDSENVVVYDDNEYFRMGLGGCKFTNGEYGDWKIAKYEKWNEHNRDKVRDLIFKPTDKVKLSINQCYKDSNINIIKTNITSVHIRNPKYSTNVSLINFYIGKNDLTLSQANSIIKVMGLNYQLTDSVDWSSVAIGTEITWTETKEEYMNDKEIENIAKNIYKALTNTITDNHNELSQAIALLQSNGYTLTPPYIQPTDDEICERIKSMSEEVGYVADFSVVDNKYYIYFVDNKYDYGGSQTCKILNTPYTTQSIAQQIVAELNEKRFVRV